MWNTGIVWEDPGCKNKNVIEKKKIVHVQAVLALFTQSKVDIKYCKEPKPILHHIFHFYDLLKG